MGNMERFRLEVRLADKGDGTAGIGLDPRAMALKLTLMEQFGDRGRKVFQEWLGNIQQSKERRRAGGKQ